MELFGERDKFAIEYGFEANPFGEVGLYGMSWGTFRLWVQGCDVCSFSKDGNFQMYKWNLIGIFEWLCNNLEHVLNEDQFPVPAVGGSTLELIDDSYNHAPEDDNDLDDWADKKQDWEFRHSWYPARAGSFLARVYFRCVSQKQIEVSWDNSSIYAKHGVLFECPKGLSLVDVCEFKSVIKCFMKDFANKLSNQLPEDGPLDSMLPRGF